MHLQPFGLPTLAHASTLPIGWDLNAVDVVDVVVAVVVIVVVVEVVEILAIVLEVVVVALFSRLLFLFPILFFFSLHP